MENPLKYFILAAIVAVIVGANTTVANRLPLLPANARNTFDLIVFNSNYSSQEFYAEANFVSNNPLSLSSLKDTSDFQNAIVAIHAGNMPKLFKNLLQIHMGPSHWIYIMVVDQMVFSSSDELQIQLQSCLAMHRQELLKININTKIFIITNMKKSGLARIITGYELYTLKDLVIIQNITFHIPLSFTALINLHLPRQNLWNSSIRAVAQPLELLIPGQLTTRFTDNKFQFLSGYDFEMLSFIADALNFSIVPVAGYGFVTKSKNGTLTGMGKQILNDEADISTISQEMLLERKEYLTFLFPTAEFTINAFLLKRSNNYLKDIFFRAFDLSIWIMITFVWILLGLSMWFVMILKRKWDSLSKNDAEIGSNSFIWAVGTARLLGWHILPDSPSLRVIFICGHITGLFFYNAYYAAFTSILSTDDTLIKTPGDITKFQYKILIDDLTRILTVVVERLEGNKAIDEASLLERITPFSKAIDQVYSKQVAYVSDAGIFYPLLRNHLHSRTNMSCSAIDAKICKDIVQIRATYTSFKSAWFVKKLSPLAPILNQKLVLMHERGLRHRYQSIYFRDTSVRCLQRKSSHETNEPMMLPDIWTVFVMLAAGTFVSLVLLTFEKVVFKLNSN